jgi:glyoxylase-like metal-dependent hydrolase (beta-lactamase superfamily II)/8-oxo-dGTP pyrophosphatase MutT (NUDIX family)
VKRGALRFAGGFYAFPGGRLDPEDARVEVPGFTGDEAALRACAAREIFEETGVLLAMARDGARQGTGPRPADRDPCPTEQERSAARRALLEGALGFGDFLDRHALRVDGARLLDAGRWITPPQFPLRYDARVFVAAMPEGQRAEVWPGELTEGAWIAAADAEAHWERGEVLLHPPNLWGVQCLAAAAPPACLERLRAPPATEGFITRRVEFQRGLFLAALRTPTLPPATHTNCWIPELGGGALALVDPGSPWPEEQESLERVLDDLRQDGLAPREIWLTHAHPDHVGGVAALRARRDLVLRAHPDAVARLPGDLGAVEPLSEGERLPGGWRALHTPGHALGHVAFLHERSGALLAGDMVSTLSTIVIDPPEGDMAEYLRSLERLRALGPRTLFPAHGPPTQGATEKLAEYLQHRRDREAKVLAAATLGGSLGDITARAYDDAPAAIWPVAERSCLASLLKLEREGRVTRNGEVWSLRHTGA